MLNLQRQGQLNKATKDKPEIVLNTRARVQSQNIQKRKKLESGSNALYYQIRKASQNVNANYDQTGPIMDLAEI